MRLIGRNRLAPLRAKSPEVDKWTTAWVAEVVNAHWACPNDISSQFPNSSQEVGNIFLFPVLQCRWSIALLVTFPHQTALVTALRVE